MNTLLILFRSNSYCRADRRCAPSSLPRKRYQIGSPYLQKHYIQRILKMVDAERNQTKSKEFCRQTTILEKEKIKNKKISTHTRTS